ncbi:50S ribosomal protein L3-2 [Diplonema papillatum]|nr:50S ribosomal protein L3-2 [Diplonema papillatum]
MRRSGKPNAACVATGGARSLGKRAARNALRAQVRPRHSVQTRRSFPVRGSKLTHEWFNKAPFEPFSFAERWGPDKGFFHRDNAKHVSVAMNPWGFLYPGGKVQSPLWQSDPGIGPHEVAGTPNDGVTDDIAYRIKMEHNHPETRWDHEPTPFGVFDYDFSRRVGMVGIKVGKVTQVDDYGNLMNASVVWCPDQHIIAQRTREADGACAMTVGAYNAEHGQLNLAELCAEAGVPQKKVSAHFSITEDAYLPVGTRLDVRHFVPGQLVSTTSRTIERGFQGVVKRWGFKGGPGRYGPLRSKAWHRRPGSMSSGEAVGKIVKGKRMPGHMGGLLRTTGSSWVWRVDYKNQLLYILGNLPGPMGQFVTLMDSNQRKFDYWYGAPPFPTFVPDEEEDLSQVSWDDAQLVSRSRIGFPKEVGRMPAAELLETYNFAKKQKELMAAEHIATSA